MKETCILINNRDRPTELALLLQSIRTQTYKDWDIVIIDDCSGTTLNNYHFLNMIITRMLLEGHQISIQRNEFVHGVSKARQRAVDFANSLGNYKYYCRLDDDVILSEDYLDRLIKVINSGYDLASGVTIPFTPTFKRDPKFLKGIGNRIVLDKEGNFLFNGDDFGTPYLRSEIVKIHHFRSCALYKREIHEKVNYTPTRLSNNGFREEELFSLKCLMNGFKLGADTQATTFHLCTPSGGERDTMDRVPFNEMILKEFVKENLDKLPSEFFTEINELERMKENNCIR